MSEESEVNVFLLILLLLLLLLPFIWSLGIEKFDHTQVKVEVEGNRVMKN